jgi:hypothetical protein
MRIFLKEKNNKKNAHQAFVVFLMEYLYMWSKKNKYSANVIQEVPEFRDFWYQEGITK